MQTEWGGAAATQFASITNLTGVLSAADFSIHLRPEQEQSEPMGLLSCPEQALFRFRQSSFHLSCAAYPSSVAHLQQGKPEFLYLRPEQSKANRWGLLFLPGAGPLPFPPVFIHLSCAAYPSSVAHLQQGKTRVSVCSRSSVSKTL